MVGTMKLRVDENEADKLNKVKKFGVPTATETTKRAALGDLQNRAVLRTATSKELASKDIKDTKLQNALRSTKARVDSRWKAAPTTAAPSGAEAAVQRKVLTRANTLRTSGGNNDAAAAVKGTTLQRNGSVVGQNKLKTTLTTKVVENKLQQVKYVYKGKSTQNAEDKKTLASTLDEKAALKREDSNLSRKSLTKLKAALSRDVASVTTKTAAIKANVTTAAAAPALVKNELAATNVAKNSEKPAVASVSIKQARQATVATANTQLTTHSSRLLYDDVEDIDADDGENLLLVSEYANDIYNYLYSIEAEQRIRENHLDKQEEVHGKMRAILVDWINEVHFQFHLAMETYQMAVAIIDRYLQAVHDTKRSHLQLVGVTALFIAAKYEELFPPATADFVYITDSTYTARQILQMELKIFKALDCNLSRPLPIHFLRRYSKAAKAHDHHHAMAKYFLELVSIEYDMASYKPSEIAAASLFLALHLLQDNAKLPTGFNDSHWTPTLKWYSHYSAERLRPIAKKIATLARNAPNAKQRAVYIKYQSQKFDKISMRPELSSALIDSIIKSKE